MCHLGVEAVKHLIYWCMTYDHFRMLLWGHLWWRGNEGSLCGAGMATACNSHGVQAVLLGGTFPAGLGFCGLSQRDCAGLRVIVRWPICDKLSNLLRDITGIQYSRMGPACFSSNKSIQIWNALDGWILIELHEVNPQHCFYPIGAEIFSVTRMACPQQQRLEKGSVTIPWRLQSLGNCWYGGIR